MSARTRDLVGFFVVLVAFSALSLVLWAPLMRGYAALLAAAGAVSGSSDTSVALAGSANLLYVVPAVAVIVAAQGATWRRKVAWLAVLVGGLLAVHLLLALSGATSIIAASAGNAPAGAAATVLVYHTFPIVWPVVVVFMFVGSKPAMLWESQERGGGADAAVRQLPPD